MTALEAMFGIGLFALFAFILRQPHAPLVDPHRPPLPLPPWPSPLPSPKLNVLWKSPCRAPPCSPRLSAQNNQKTALSGAPPPDTAARNFSRTQSNRLYASGSASGSSIPQWGQ